MERVGDHPGSVMDRQMRVPASCAHHSHYHPGGSPDLRRWAEKRADGRAQGISSNTAWPETSVIRRTWFLRSFLQNFRSRFHSLRSCFPSDARSFCFSCHAGDISMWEQRCPSNISCHVSGSGPWVLSEAVVSTCSGQVLGCRACLEGMWQHWCSQDYSGPPGQFQEKTSSFQRTMSQDTTGPLDVWWRATAYCLASAHCPDLLQVRSELLSHVVLLPFGTYHS